MKYWGELQESAIIDFNTNENTDSKHKVYNDVILPAFSKLVENIYYTYNFNKILFDYQQTRHEAMAHLYEKLGKFDPTSGAKSFSYFGTIVKNWMIQQSNAAKKQVFVDNENVDTVVFDKSMEFYEDIEKTKDDYAFIEGLIGCFDDLMIQEALNKDDLAVLEIINDIMKNYHKFNIYNKKQLYVYVREATDLPSRKITKSIKKIKKTYMVLKDEYIN
jgi:hypothetical protein|tara:strand:+ start:1728 stop:2381 length:654 start_codon:yes stop_codon:yes gene_type:complete